MDILGQILQEQTPIYNRYLNGDYQAGDDNLNPKRELQPDYAQSMVNLRLTLYLRYKDMITAAKGDNAIAAPSDLGIPYVHRTQVISPVQLRDGMAPSAAPIPIEQDLHKMLKVIHSFLIGGEPLTLDDLPYDICNDRPPAPATPISAGSTPGGATVSSGLTGADNTGDRDNPSTGSSTTASDIKCVMVELQMLLAIFQLIAFVQKILALERFALAYIYPYIEFVEQVVACYLNPSMIAQLVMSLVGQVLAIGIGMLVDAISQWLGSLNLDCLMSNVMSEIQQILGSINGIGDLGSAVGSFVNFNANLAANTLRVGGAVVSALNGNSKALYQALGIPENQQTAADLTAGQFFDMAMRTQTGVDIRSIPGQAARVFGAGVGAVAAPVQGAINGVTTSANSIDGSAKLIKDYWPGGQFSTF
jgi:hypothetical protein